MELSPDTFIIAEAGVNHNGSIELAERLVDIAVEAGANAVKFQTFKTELCLTKEVRRAKYQQKDGESISQFDLVKALELSADNFRHLSEYCKKKNISFLSTAFDLPSLRFLIDELNIPVVKIPSGDILNGPLLLAAARAKKPILLSTGMCNLGDIENALSVIAFGLLGENDDNACMKNFHKSYSSNEAQNLLGKYVTLLHCTTEYPAPFEDVNLTSLSTLKSAFGLRVGFSDHSVGIPVSLGAVALGATVIEKHFTIDQGMHGPDHKASLAPNQLIEMVRGIRDIEKSLGDGRKYPRLSERDNIEIARKYLVCNQPISAGQPFRVDDLIPKRSHRGISPIYLWDLIGQKSTRDYQQDEVIQFGLDI